MTAVDLISEMERFPNNTLADAPSFPEVDTGSNLWPSIFQNLLVDADIVSNEISVNMRKIRTLVSRRNEIAHGQKNMIEEMEYYLSYESAVYDIMYELAYLIDERLSKPPYDTTQ